MPKRPKLTLKQPKPPTTVVKFPRSTSNPAGGIVDPGALRRQKEQTVQALNLASGSMTTKLTNGPAPVAIMPAPLERMGSGSGSAGTPPVLSRAPSSRVDVMNFKPERSTPLPASLPHVSTSLLTPATPGFPPQLAPTPLMNGYHPVYAPIQTNKPYVESDSPIERKFRDSGKGIEDALLGSVTFMTHPKLPNDPKWKLDRYASATRTQTSSYIYLPTDHYYLRVIPHLTDKLFQRRRYKLCVTRNWENKLENQEGSGMYDFRILPGLNEICIDVIADLAEGERKEYAPSQLQVDFERIKFVVVLRDASPE